MCLAHLLYIMSVGIKVPVTGLFSSKEIHPKLPFRHDFKAKNSELQL